jgi:TonB family protein
MSWRPGIMSGLLLFGALGFAGEAVPPAPNRTQPKVISKVDPVWPEFRIREGLVNIEFDLLANGKIANIRVADGGFYTKSLADAAIAAVRQYRIEPARLDGKPVDTYGISQPFTFFQPDVKQGVTAAFLRELKQIEDLIRANELAGAEHHAQWMLSEKVTLRYEYAALHAKLAELYARKGALSDAAASAYRATRPSATALASPGWIKLPVPATTSNRTYLLPKEVVVKLLDLRFRFLADLNMYREALDAFYELAALVEIPGSDPRKAQADEFLAKLTGSERLVAKMEIGQSRRLRQHLSRQSFTLENIKGGVMAIKVDCVGRTSVQPSVKHDYVAGRDWMVPLDAEACAVTVEGDPGASFDFVEHPNLPGDSGSVRR